MNDAMILFCSICVCWGAAVLVFIGDLRSPRGLRSLMNAFKALEWKIRVGDQLKTPQQRTRWKEILSRIFLGLLCSASMWVNQLVWTTQSSFRNQQQRWATTSNKHCPGLTLISFLVLVWKWKSSDTPATMYSEIFCSFMDISMTSWGSIWPARL